MAKPLTKAQLLARINELEAEMAGLYQAQRPSRTQQPDISDDGSRTSHFTDRAGRTWAKTTRYEGKRQITRTRCVS